MRFYFSPLSSRPRNNFKNLNFLQTFYTKYNPIKIEKNIFQKNVFPLFYF